MSGRANLKTSQTALSVTASAIAVAFPGRRMAEVKNTDASISVYVGASGVTSSTGHLLKAGESFVFEDFDGAIYAVAASSTPTVTVIEW